jgi:hypothetical protein
VISPSAPTITPTQAIDGALSAHPKTPLLATSAEELAPAVAEWHEKPYRAKQIVHRLWQLPAASFADINLAVRSFTSF